MQTDATTPKIIGLTIGSFYRFFLRELNIEATTTTTTTTFSRNNRFNDQNNSSALASRFLVHFFDVHRTTSTWNLLIWRFIEDVDIRRQIFLPLFELENILKNSTPGKVAYIWYVERVQIDAIKFERTKIHFLATFSLPWSSSLLKVPL